MLPDGQWGSGSPAARGSAPSASARQQQRQRPSCSLVSSHASSSASGPAFIVMIFLASLICPAYAQPTPARATAPTPVTVAPTPSPAPTNSSKVKPLGAATSELRLAAAKTYGNTTIAFLEWTPAGGGVSRTCSQQDFFTDHEAALTCRFYGYSGGGLRMSKEATVAQLTASGKSRNITALTLLHCHNKTSLPDCTYSAITANNPACTPDSVILLKCFGEGALRMVDSPPNSPYEGRVQIYFENQWRSLCTQGLNPASAKTVCRLMGMDFNASAPSIRRNSSEYDPQNKRFNESQVWSPRTFCTGNETVFAGCTTQILLEDIGDPNKCWKGDGGKGYDTALDCRGPRPTASSGASVGVRLVYVLALAWAVLQLAC